MKKFYLMFIVAFLANAGCASERLYVKVTDDNGAPVSNATVHVEFSTSYVVFGNGRPCHYEAKTDSSGNAIVKFNCKSSDIWWHIEADGYYRSESRKEYFRGDNVLIPPCFGYWHPYEYEKNGEITLYPIKNPQPMFSYSQDKKVKMPIENGKYGFDLEIFDWLSPLGKGKVADFYYVRDRKDCERIAKLLAENKTHRVSVFRSDEADAPKLGDVVGRIEFEPYCGAYICTQTGNQNFPSTYRADPKAEYKSVIPIRICENNGKLWLQEGPVVGKDKYVVIRSRVKLDEQGNIVSANYSKILGPWRVGVTMFSHGSVFNPVPNDTNLEFDPQKNLYQGKKGRGMIP